MRIRRLTLPIIVVLACAVQADPQKQRTTETKLSSEERQLIDARRANEEAQAKYYQEQALRMRNPAPTPTPSPSKSFQQSIAENPASVLGVVGTIIAALFTALAGILALSVNSRATLRSHVDTQFYDALKLFGDKNSSVRSSGAGILGRMANIERMEFDLRHPIHSLLNRKQPYYGIAHNQLVIGLVSEENVFTLLQIRRAIYQIVDNNPSGLATMLINANARLQTELRKALASFFIANGAPDDGSVSEDLWKKIPQNVYKHEVFKYLVNCDNSFSESYAGLLLDFKVFADDVNKTRKNLAVTYKNLTLTTYRLFLIVDIYCAVLRRSPVVGTHERNYPLFMVNADLNKMDLNHANLKNSLLSGAKLQRANLESAQLQGAWLDNADVTEGRLAGAKLDDKTKINNVNWWKANYYIGTNHDIDSHLLRYLNERDGSNVPQNVGEVHQSVQDFIKDENSTNDAITRSVDITGPTRPSS